MKKYTPDELKIICEKHIKWLRNEEGGECANLRNANFQGANLQGANLQGANLQGANLQGANLQGANLQGADLQSADLRRANLQRANFQGADLRGADLRRADFQGADLRDADLDYSCLPLWCGGSRFKADSRIVRQLFAHIVMIEIADADDGIKVAIEAIKMEASKSHRAQDLGLIGEHTMTRINKT